MAEEPKLKRITRWYRAPLPKGATVITEADLPEDLDLPTRNGPFSEIDRIGIGSEIIRLRKEGLTQEEIAKQFNLSRDQIQGWLEKYQKLPPEKKQAVKQRSIFEMSDRLQETFERLEKILIEVQGENRDLEIKVLDKILKAVAQAGVLVEKIELYKANQRFKETVLDLLDQEAPGIRAKALKRLSEYHEGITALRPLN